MIVLKFGGTSVGTVDSLRNVKSIVEGLEQPSVVVVSALGGLTDRLIATAQKAAEGDMTFSDDIDAIAKRHHEIIDALVADDKKEAVRTLTDNLMHALGRLYQGVNLIEDLPAKTLDKIVSFGERMSSVIVAGIIDGAVHKKSPDFVKTEKWFDKNVGDADLTIRLIGEEFKDQDAWPVVMGGFIASDKETGEITNLGRGGSDYTAALVAAALDAELLQIWTDVSGFMTADPRIIPDARIIPEMSFTESMELCSFGAKVIYPPTIYPVFHKNIPIKILNTFRPEDPGTLITDKPKREKVPVTGVSSIADTALVTLCGDLPEDNTEVSSRSLNALAKKGISTYMMGRDSDPHCFSFAIAGADVKNAMRLLNEEFAPELSRGALHEIRRREGLSTIAIVGDSLKEFAELPGQIHTLLMGQGIQVYATASAQSRTTATFVVGKEDVKKGLSIIHSILYPKTAN